MVNFSFINCTNASNITKALSICYQPNSVQPADDATSDYELEKGAMQEERWGIEKPLGHHWEKCLSKAGQNRQIQTAESEISPWKDY